MEDSVSHSWADEPEGGYTVTPPIKLNPEGWPGFTPEQLEKLQQMAEDAARELRELPGAGAGPRRLPKVHRAG